MHWTPAYAGSKTFYLRNFTWPPAISLVARFQATCLNRHTTLAHRWPSHKSSVKRYTPLNEEQDMRRPHKNRVEVDSALLKLINLLRAWLKRLSVTRATYVVWYVLKKPRIVMGVWREARKTNKLKTFAVTHTYIDVNYSVSSQSCLFRTRLWMHLNSK